jgi:hypothetical protein
MSRLNWNRVYVVLAVVATATLAACVLMTRQASDRIQASLRCGEEWSERLDRYERLGAMAAAVNDRARSALWSSHPETERARMKAALESFNLAYADAVGELRLATPSAATNAVLGGLHDIDGAMTEVVSRAETDIVRPAESGIEEPELSLVLGALAAEFSTLNARVQTIQDQQVASQLTVADARRLAEQILAGAVGFLVLGVCFYGGRRIGRPHAAVVAPAL